MQKSLLPMNICMQRPFLPMQRKFQFSGQTSNGMTRNNHSPPYNISAADDDEYIDIEVNSFSPESRSFEFQMCSVFTGKQELNTFPADDLFYKGKLLPPRLLETTAATPTGDHNSFVEEDDQFIIMEFASSMSPGTSSTPVEPCRLSFALNPDDDHFKRSTCLSTSINKKYCWFSKLRVIKKCLIGNRQKASRACLRSFFRKSACIDVSSAMAPAGGTDKRQVSNGGEGFHLKVEQKKTLFGHIGMWRHKVSNHRRSVSFSSSSAEYKRRRSPIKCLASSSSSSASSSSFSSSSISFSSTDFYELNFHNRSCSFTSHIDGPIEAAIVHCKKSQQLSNSRKPLTKSGHFALSTPKISTK